MMIVRHLLAILLLPFVVVWIIPRWALLGWSGSDTQWIDGSPATTIAHTAGALVFVAGFGLFVWCVALFARVGEGTLAPWDPTRRLVVVGPYRYVRNPMITGVLAMLVGESIYFGSRLIATWAATFFVINTVYFVLLEEPGLKSRFGESYADYKSAVGRWLPTGRPWKNV